MTNSPHLLLLEETKAVGPKQPLRISSEIMRTLKQGGKPHVLSALQTAIKLEHSTIPPYLYALYSLDAGKNPDIAAIIRSVVVEEMLHMTLACNILNALGGAPAIDTPEFIPCYPGTLPGIEPPPGWQVDLAPFSIDVVRNIFMQIEMPEDPHDYPAATLKPVQTPKDEPHTIGAFYHTLKQQIEKLGDSAFVPATERQVGPDIMRDAIKVEDVKTACEAINTIVGQGEGVDPNDPMEDDGHTPAHYYRFAEIVKGRQLIEVQVDPPAYAYVGNGVTFDPSGVLNVAPDRTGTCQAVLTFNYTYTNLLKTLHRFFNGQNTKPQFDAALGLMMSLKQQAQAMMSILERGPSFEYQPVHRLYW